MKRWIIAAIICLCSAAAVHAADTKGFTPEAKAMIQPLAAPSQEPQAVSPGYTIGVDDVLDINVLQPEKISTTVTVAPDGTINFPYIGSRQVKGKSIAEAQDVIQRGLADGYMRYPVVSISLRESRSRKFFVYGEVVKPGTYALDESTTVLRAISMAGGFSRFGSSSRVKVLRLHSNKPGYETIKINIKGIMDGSSNDDILLRPDDIVVVSEGVF